MRLLTPDRLAHCMRASCADTRRALSVNLDDDVLGAVSSLGQVGDHGLNRSNPKERRGAVAFHCQPHRLARMDEVSNPAYSANLPE
jgi:hypothetical protein